MEKVDIYDKFRGFTGRNKNRDDLSEGEYRISVHVWIINSSEQLLLQLRSKKEDKFPNMWGQTGGGVKSGDTSKQTVILECKEELGIDINDEKLYYVGSYTRIRDIVDVWLLKQDIDIANIKLQQEEVVDVKYISFEDCDKLISQGKVIPTINPSYSLMKNYYFKYMKNRMY